VGKGGISVLRSVGKYPFALAYDVFRSSLERSSRWLVVGYSFRDEVIIETLREVFSTEMVLRAARLRLPLGGMKIQKVALGRG
jgi:hypothetical protein